MKKIKKVLLFIVGFVLLTFITIVMIHLTREELTSNFLDKELEKIERHLDFRDQKNMNVSGASVAWHLDHMLLVVNRIYDQMNQSEPAQFKNRFNFLRTMSLTLNRIPRGAGKSPKAVNPIDNIPLDSILSHLKETRKRMDLFDSLNESSFFQHPYFGKLNRKQAKRFLKIHTQHHLKIIDDILDVSK